MPRGNIEGNDDGTLVLGAYGVALWGVLNALMVGLLIGFVVSGFGGTWWWWKYTVPRGLGFLVALATWLAPAPAAGAWARVERSPTAWPPCSCLAVAFALLWLGLPFGERVPMIAALPLITAGFMELYARRGIRKLPPPAPGATHTSRATRKTRPACSPRSGSCPSACWPSAFWPSSSASDSGFSRRVRT